jgi:hypothetical protein
VQAPGVERSEPPTPPGQLAAPAEPSRRQPGGGGQARETEGGPRFRTLLLPGKLARGECRANSGGALAGAASEASRAPAPFAAPLRELAIPAVAPRPEVARLLIAQAHAVPEARIELRGGLLAGASIHLVSAPGGVEVRLGAPTEAARVALAGMIDRVGLHLRSRGIVIRPGAPLDTGSRQSQRDERGRR